MVKYIPIDGITAKDTARAFYLNVWKDHGLPYDFITDRGTQFESYFWYELYTRYRIKASLSTAFYLEIDG